MKAYSRPGLTWESRFALPDHIGRNWPLKISKSWQSEHALQPDASNTRVGGVQA
jgi:hypothetical protein